MLQFKSDDERQAWDEYAAAALQSISIKWASSAPASGPAGRPMMAGSRDNETLVKGAVDLADQLLEERRKRK